MFPKNRPSFFHFLAQARQFHASAPRYFKSQSPFANMYSGKPASFWIDHLQQQEKKHKVPLSSPPPSPPLSAPLPVTPIEPKPIQTSYVERYLPLASDPALLDSYITTKGGIHLGKLMSDMDAISGVVACKHAGVTLPNDTAMQFVTASTDRIDIQTHHHHMVGIQDLKVSAHAIHVGTSSLVSQVTIETVGSNPCVMMGGTFTMVAINTATLTPMPIPPLALVTAQDKKISHQVAEKGQLRRKKHRPHKVTEDKRRHLMELKSSSAQALPMHTTKMQSMFMIHPQDRNMYNILFGGMLIEKATELAEMTGCHTLQFLSTDKKKDAAAAAVTVASWDRIEFHQRTPVGAMLCLTSHLLYVNPETYQICVHTTINNNNNNNNNDSKNLTSSFYFTLHTNTTHHQHTEPLKVAVPQTSHEIELYLAGRRPIFD
ncbi:hypothetical protein BCR42DRAFT_398549 [Absidia repens]|uniref:HotDog ACOT-type domain-containing protein n=1 Tax=Absidia repens TaxID=90262 RepID=A0A1X2HXY0_9FUNG|nr:hypothetical protein BCR42DRAFT_398549 [Absidia repens]